MVERTARRRLLDQIASSSGAATEVVMPPGERGYETIEMLVTELLAQRVSVDEQAQQVATLLATTTNVVAEMVKTLDKVAGSISSVEKALESTLKDQRAMLEAHERVLNKISSTLSRKRSANLKPTYGENGEIVDVQVTSG